MLSSAIGLGALGAYEGAKLVNQNNLRRTTPNEHSAIKHAAPIRAAAEARAKQIAPDSDMQLAVKPESPESGRAWHGRATDKTTGKSVHTIGVNPNSHASIFAHELGHAVSQQTGPGRLLNDIKTWQKKHPKLRNATAFATAMYAAPAFAAGALQEGNDDVAGSIGLSMAVAAPTLIDEALASKNAMAIMKDAGLSKDVRRAGAGRLAGAYLTYLAAPVMYGALGNVVGNMADDYTAIYDL